MLETCLKAEITEVQQKYFLTPQIQLCSYDLDEQV